MKKALLMTMGILLVVLWAGAVCAGHSRFVFSEDTVKDRQTGLVWFREADLWRDVTWDDAQELIKTMNREKSGGYTDWRIPSKEELETLLVYARNSGNKDGESNLSPDDLYNKMGFSGVRSTPYWTSTPDATNPNNVWYVDIKYGRADVFNKQGFSFFVWPVRGGK